MSLGISKRHGSLPEKRQVLGSRIKRGRFQVSPLPFLSQRLLFAYRRDTAGDIAIRESETRNRETEQLSLLFMVSCQTFA